MLKKKSNWVELLEQEIQKAEKSEFVWEGNNCALFYCNCVLAMTGFDLGEWFRGKCSTEKKSYLALRKYAGTLENVIEKICEEQGFPEIPLLKAQRGDPVLLKGDDDPMTESLGIVSPNGDIVARDTDQKYGIIRVPLSVDLVDLGCRAWRLNG